MPITNLQFLNYSDTQSQFIRKTNHNFDEIVEAHGGSLGTVGPTGSAGPIGIRGPIGPTGTTGARGNRWFVTGNVPPPGSVGVVEGDFWVNELGDIFVFTESGWVSSGYALSRSASTFINEKNDSIYIEPSPTGTTGGNSILLDQIFPGNYVFVLADKVPQANILDETLSKFVISTDSTVNTDPVLEFSKSDIADGSLADYTQHPVFKWVSTNPNDNSMLLQIPGGSFYIGASGGYSSNFNIFNSSTPGDLNINYGTDPGSGIYSTGGFEFNYPSGQASIKSSVLNISGGSGSIDSRISLNPSGISSPSISVVGGATSGISTQRSGDTFDSISHNTYMLSLESLSGREFGLDTKGKIKTKKTREGITYSPTRTPGATGATGAVGISWFFVSRAGTSSSQELKDGNTIVIDPSGIQFLLGVSRNGIGIYSDILGSWTGTGGISPGQSIDISVMVSPSSIVAGRTPYIHYIGAGTTGGGFSPIVALDPVFGWATSVDLTLTKGPTGTIVFYKAYGAGSGKGGSFII
jgi:hypothetical protein